jgi:hypothetical protein
MKLSMSKSQGIDHRCFFMQADYFCEAVGEHQESFGLKGAERRIGPDRPDLTQQF